MEPYPNRIDSARCVNSDQDGVTFLPLMDCEMKLLPIHFLTQAEVSSVFLVSFTFDKNNPCSFL